MLSRPKKTALENVSAQSVLAIDPPGEIQHQLVEHALEKCQIALPAMLLAVYLKHAPGRPGVHRRVHIAERPLVGGNLAVGVHVPFARQQHQLMLRELRIDQGERDAMKRQVPGGVPGVLPFVRHREDVGIVEITPFDVASMQPCLGRRRLAGVALEPARNIEIVELLAPNQSGKGLALNHACIGRGNIRLQIAIVVIGLGAAQCQDVGRNP